MRHRAPGLHLRKSRALPRLLWIASTASLLDGVKGSHQQRLLTSFEAHARDLEARSRAYGRALGKPTGEPACLWKRKGSGQAGRLRLSCERRPRAGTLRRRGGFAHPANCTQQVQRFG